VLLDSLMREFDASRIEHRVIDGQPTDVYEAAIHTDFVDAMRRSRIVRAMFSLRAALERVAATARYSPVVKPPESILRLADMPEHGDWVRLAEDAPNEFAFGGIGRFWAGETKFEQIDASVFTSFDTPGYAKIAASLSLRSYGSQRTLLSYEARTQATDDAARRAFLRYWTVVSPAVGVVMRSLLAVIAEETPGAGEQPTRALRLAR
jgi:hypothetical protein